MAKFNQISKVIRVPTIVDIVRYQLVTYCFINRIKINERDLDCLILMATSNEQELNEFCVWATVQDIFKSPQSARNSVVKLEKKGLIVKIGNSKKKIYINPIINLINKGNVIINHKFVYLESN